MNTRQPRNDSHMTPPMPWWRIKMVWLVVGGPLAVVVASFVTLAIAIVNPDPVLTAGPAAKGSDMPAVQARNHAATPQR